MLAAEKLWGKLGPEVSKNEKWSRILKNTKFSSFIIFKEKKLLIFFI
jgi:hypothetical protein